MKRILTLTAFLALAGTFAGTALAAPPVNNSEPTISGSAREGQTLTANPGTWSGSPTSFTYQWRRCDTNAANCSNIIGAIEKTYTLGSADVGRTIRVRVTARNADGSTNALSNATSRVAAKEAPRNTARPVISGSAIVGSELTASRGTWTPEPTSFAFQWQRCDTTTFQCTNIAGATGETYGVRSADVDQRLRVVVTARNTDGAASAESDTTAVVRSNATPPPAGNRAPTITLISARFVGLRLYVRARICDDSRSNVNLLARDTKAGVSSYLHRFATLVPPNPCAAVTRSWVPPTRFRTGRYRVTLQARDKSGKVSRIVGKTFFR